uniref:Uncharacterized protein n=1 Tax=Sinocyclocheilus rhinocerous TaxID=307959 RepID=A0A673HS31_9TELE
MFWFPSEAFQEEKEQPGISTDFSSVKNPTEDESHMTVKTTNSQSGPDIIAEESDYTTDPPTDEPTSPSAGDHSLDQQERAGEGACAEDPCHGSGRGPMIAAIIVGIVAAVMGVVLGVWCYKKRQQKSSHYQLNGTNRQTQCIELQQTV